MSRARDLADLGNNAGGLETLTVSDITDLTATASELNKLDGVTATKDELNLVDGSVTGPLSHRNLIINGGMQVWQRGTSSTNVASTPMRLADRWECRSGAGSTHTVIQSTDVPTSEGDGKSGFAYSLKFTVGSSAGTISSSTADNYFNYKMEGQDFYHAKWGTAQAKTITLSFWVKSSVTGDYGLMFGKDLSQTYSTKYTISSANTWEKKTITITGPSSGTWQNDANVSLRIIWNWGAGSNYTTSTLETWGTDDDRGGYDGGSAVQLVANANATWYITGIQLELGSVATPFEHRSFGDELLRCQRYYSRHGTDQITHAWLHPINTDNTGGYRRGSIHFPVEMRSTPSVNGSFNTGSFSTQDINSAMFTSVANGIGASSYLGVTGWNASAEL